MAALALGPLAILPRAWHWWVGELAELVPSWLKRRFARATDRVVLLPGNGEVALYLEANQGMRLLGNVDLAAEGEANRRVGFLLQRALLDRGIAAGKIGVCVRIPADRALRTVIELPAAAERNLDEVVSFELDRHTPFRADQVLFAPRVLGRDPTTQRLETEILLVPRPTVDDMMAIAARLHLEPNRVDIAEADGPGPASDNLLRTEARRASTRGRTVLVLALSGLAVVLAIVAVALPILRAQWAAEDLADQFALVKQTGVKDVALQKEIDELRRNELFLIEKKRNTPSVSALLFETTRILPDSTWLSDWQFAGTEVQLQGVSESASAVVGLLEQSHVFSRTTFLSPVTQDPNGHEHFHISTQSQAGGKKS
jgi:general secretion pathway protein L